jgi:predicted small lipoprotein YifL
LLGFDIHSGLGAQYKEPIHYFSVMIAKKNINRLVVNFAKPLKSLLLVVPIATIAACGNSGNLAEQTAPETSPQSNPTTTAPVEPSSPGNNSRYKELYPPEAIAQYVDVCTAAGDSDFFCNCFVIKAQEHYTLAELVELSNNAHPSKPIPSKVKTIAEFCLQNDTSEPAYPEPFDAPEGLEPPIEEVPSSSPETPSASPRNSSPSTALVSNHVELQPIRSPIQGSCECPYDLDKNNNQCMKRSAYSRPGGAQPSCYVGE